MRSSAEVLFDKNDPKFWRAVLRVVIRNWATEYEKLLTENENLKKVPQGEGQRGVHVIKSFVDRGQFVLDGGVAKSGVCYWYDQPPVQNKQEIKKPVRFMTKKERLDMLAIAGAQIALEIEKILDEGVIE